MAGSHWVTTIPTISCIALCHAHMPVAQLPVDLCQLNCTVCTSIFVRTNFRTMLTLSLKQSFKPHTVQQRKYTLGCIWIHAAALLHCTNLDTTEFMLPTQQAFVVFLMPHSEQTHNKKKNHCIIKKFYKTTRCLRNALLCYARELPPTQFLLNVSIKVWILKKNSQIGS